MAKATKKAAKKATKKAGKKAGKKAPKGGKLAQVKGVLNKALKTDDWHTQLDPSMLKKSVPFRSTGSIILNYLIGGRPNEAGIPPCPGLPQGGIFNLYGHEASGKTTVALTVAATVIKEGGVVCFIDWEHEIVPQYAAALGVPIHDETKFMLCQPDTLEQGLAILWTMASAGVELIVCDSVGAGVPMAYFNKSVQDIADGESGRLGANAAAWSQFLPRLKARSKKTGSTIIAISQIRASLNTTGYGEKSTVQGGWAFKFYSAVRMKLQKVGTEKASDYSAMTNKTEQRVTGARIRARLDKCKVSDQQNNEEFFYIRWGEGIDDLRSIIEIAVAHNLVRKQGAWIKWTDPTGEEHSKQGMEKFRAIFVHDKNLLRMLEQQVMPFMATKMTPEAEREDDEEFDPNILEVDADIQDLIGALDKMD